MSIHPDALAARLPRTIGLSNDRLQTLVVLIQGLINARTVNLSHLAGSFCGPAKVSSNYRRLQRFFQYVSLDEDWLARALVALLGLKPPYRLCLDRTNWKVGRKHVNLLVLCIATQRVRIPVMWHVLDYGGGSSVAQRMGLLTRFMALFGKRSIKLLLGDAEFIGNQWFEFLVENDIPFVMRVSGHLHVCLDDGYEGPLKRLLRSRATRQRLMKAKGCFLNMEQRFGATMSFGVSQLSDGSWLIVAHRSRSAQSPQCLQTALADRMPVRRNQDARLQHGGHTPHSTAKACLAAGNHRLGFRLDAYLRQTRPATKRHRSCQTWLQAQILVPNRPGQPTPLDLHKPR